MKNPWMSMWLSGANAWAGAARGMMTAEMRRTQSAMMAEGAKQMTEFWTGAAGAAVGTKPSPAKRRRRKG